MCTWMLAVVFITIGFPVLKPVYAAWRPLAAVWELEQEVCILRTWSEISRDYSYLDFNTHTQETPLVLTC